MFACMDTYNYCVFTFRQHILMGSATQRGAVATPLANDHLAVKVALFAGQMPIKCKFPRTALET